MTLPPKPFAEGRTAEIYAWEPGWVLKLFHDWCPASMVEQEASTARAVTAAGIPAPAAREVLEVEGRRGIVYERVDGPSMLEAMEGKPRRLAEFGRMLARLHAEMHRTAPTGLPSQRARTAHAIAGAPGLTDAVRRAALDRLESLPGGVQLCHGDFHPGNVILTAGGPVAIDWMDACLGSPAADMARTRLVLAVSAPPPNPSVLLRLLILFARGVFYRAYVQEYRRLSPEAAGLSDAYLPVMAAARLSEQIRPEQEKLLKIVREKLA